MLIFEFPAKLQRHHFGALQGASNEKARNSFSAIPSALFDPPTDPAAIVRHYTLSPDDLTLIRQRRRDANRLGFAVHLAYLKFPGRILGSEETPAPDMVAFLAHQLGIESGAYREYAQRDETVVSISARYNRICAFVLSVAAIIGLSRRLRRTRQLGRIVATRSLQP